MQKTIPWRALCPLLLVLLAALGFGQAPKRPGIVVLPFQVPMLREQQTQLYDNNDRPIQMVQIDWIGKSNSIRTSLENALVAAKFRVKPIGELKEIDRTRLDNYIRGTVNEREFTEALSGELLVSGTIKNFEKIDNSRRGAKVTISVRIVDIYGEEIVRAFEIKTEADPKDAAKKRDRPYFGERSVAKSPLGNRPSESYIDEAMDNAVKDVKDDLIEGLNAYIAKMPRPVDIPPPAPLDIPEKLKGTRFMVAIDGNGIETSSAESALNNLLIKNNLDAFDRDAIEELRKEGIFEQLYNGGRLSAAQQKMLERKFVGVGVVLIGRATAERGDGNVQANLRVKAMQVPGGKLLFDQTFSQVGAVGGSGSINSVLSDAVRKNGRSIIGTVVAKINPNQDRDLVRVDVTIKGFVEARQASSLKARLSKLTARGIVSVDGQVEGGVFSGTITYRKGKIPSTEDLLNILDEKAVRGDLAFTWQTIKEDLIEGVVKKGRG